MPKLSSAEVLERVWQRFAKNYESQFGIKLSMRAVSLDVLNCKTEEERETRPGKDAQALARWTNPGDRENWRIPLARIPEVGRKLEVPAEEVDELMMARLWELSVVNPAHDSLVMGNWLAEFYARTQPKPSDETVALQVFREVAVHFPHRVLDSAADRTLLHEALEKFMAPRWAALWQEQTAERALDKAEVPVANKQRRVAVLAQLSKRHALQAAQTAQEAAQAVVVRAKDRKTVSAQVLVKQLLRDLRQRAARK